ncbi:hypothetical protein BT63DRAFT_421908 [Microthyrium microscopicum]|uniref:Methyltransferase domain-containing protein n=1 Tax=Microthyrium microscopicum TaxID=703497 RepID=A0A6A6UND0_9PEZI|nr:hypothetical protein BT63DRAFT_421908 [Microthyrium microscopicum]
MICPGPPLPLPKGFTTAGDYVDSLLDFATKSHILHYLCGGVHILDFFTQSPDLYCTIIPEEWRQWFDTQDIQDILEFLLRENPDVSVSAKSLHSTAQEPRSKNGGPMPPQSLLQYVCSIKKLCLDTSFSPQKKEASKVSKPRQSVKQNKSNYMPSNHALIAGMSPKKQHEVLHFASFVAELTDSLNAAMEKTNNSLISHIVDFGSGQNYLGRTLATKPYCKDIIAIESRPHVVQGAKRMDYRVNLVAKEVVMRNKKEFRNNSGTKQLKKSNGLADVDLESLSTFQPSNDSSTTEASHKEAKLDSVSAADSSMGSVQYVEHQISSGDLAPVIEKIKTKPDAVDVARGHNPRFEHKMMVVSLHSCGNLLHHGIRSLVLNDSVHAVAMVGCCYNLMTERLGPPTYISPSLQHTFPRTAQASARRDPHGFPMSERLATLQHTMIEPYNYLRLQQTVDSNEIEGLASIQTGLRLNLTARMMAVQAPRNWTPDTSEGFFTRHFYRALLQRIFVDKGVVDSPNHNSLRSSGVSLPDTLDGTSPIVIGALSKGCYTSFTTYVRGAVAKLEQIAIKERSGNGQASRTSDQTSLMGDELLKHRANNFDIASQLAKEKVGVLTDEEILEYETRFQQRKKDLCIVWSLMAFSAQILEALILIDRWLWLKEQDCVEEAWVQTAFEYEKSPRNMVIVGIKKSLKFEEDHR